MKSYLNNKRIKNKNNWCKSFEIGNLQNIVKIESVNMSPKTNTPNTCEIHFENNPTKVVYSGQLVRGTVQLNLSKDTNVCVIVIHRIIWRRIL